MNIYLYIGGIAPTRHPLSIHIAIDNDRKMAKFNLQKSDKNNLRIIFKPHVYIPQGISYIHSLCYI